MDKFLDEAHKKSKPWQKELIAEFCSTIHVRTKEREIEQKKVLNGYRTCTNRRSIGIMFSSFGQLRGVNSVGSDA
ncbi:6646_t:CDS:2 [Rhizophagus irregularis]|nr:6646_t:CDS:2 [Rhizophagus irregularis]